MLQDPFPDGEPDGLEPDGSGPPPSTGNGPGSVAGWVEDDGQGPGQGLFVCLPAEELSLEGFGQDGRADTMAPGPLLATVLEAVVGGTAGLAGLSDDQLMGVLSGTRRLEARIAWMQLSALAELARRRPPGGRPGDTGRAGVSDFAADEVAAEFGLSWASAAGQIGYAQAVAVRLPRCFAALAAGQIHPVHLRIIEDETRILTAENAARADEVLAEAAQSKTFGELRSAAHRLVLQLDPDAARRRKEAAKRDAHVRRFREDTGNAGLVARELPPDEVLASWQHIEQRALDLRAAGVLGTLQELRVRAYLDLLQERDSRARPGAPAATGENGDPGGTGTSGPAPHSPPPGTGPGVAALVNITVPLSTMLGRSAVPADVGGFGLLDAEDARALIAAAARHPHTRWCVTALHPDGTAAAHGCVPGRGRPPPPGTNPGPDPPPGTNRGPDPPPATQTQDYLRGLRIRLTPIARGHCDHERAERGYQPSRTLQHLIRARNRRCTAPSCNRPAARCDLDHTVAWDQGGLTCECDLAPLCRHHHRCKQAEGWQLEQPEPGVLVWRTPAGRTYATTPTEYPM